MCTLLLRFSEGNMEKNMTNCHNCGAVITSDKCEYCGTVFNKRKNEYIEKLLLKEKQKNERLKEEKRQEEKRRQEILLDIENFREAIVERDAKGRLKPVKFF